MHTQRIRRLAIALYESGLSYRAAAEQPDLEFGVALAPQTVARWAREQGKNRPVGDRRTVELPREAVRLYESGLTMKGIAGRFGVSGTTVKARFREMGIKTRPKGLKYAKLADKAWLESQYVNRGRSAKSIAQGIGCSVLTVHYHLRRHGIPRKRKR